jgi:hypothetical protein
MILWKANKILASIMRGRLNNNILVKVFRYIGWRPYERLKAVF